MREPFPELFYLELSLGDKFDVMVPVLPDSFLGGLQELCLIRIRVYQNCVRLPLLAFGIFLIPGTFHPR